MPRPKGLPKTGGRRKGSVTKAKRAEVAKAAAAGLLPHEFLLAVSQGQVFDGHTPTFDQRTDAAKAAAPFYASKFATKVEHTGKDGAPLFDLGVLSDDELRDYRAFIARMEAAAQPRRH